MQLSGQQVVYDEYGQARPNLVRRLGDYCSYCEMRVTSGLAVEHIVSKQDDPTRERDWGNFLLACPNCNSTKARKVKREADTANYLWPHRDRSFHAFDYTAGAVRVARDLDPATQAPCPLAPGRRARGETQHDISLGLFGAGVAAQACSGPTPAAPIGWLLTRAKHSCARSRAGFHHGP